MPIADDSPALAGVGRIRRGRRLMSSPLLSACRLSALLALSTVGCEGGDSAGALDIAQRIPLGLKGVHSGDLALLADGSILASSTNENHRQQVLVVATDAAVAWQHELPHPAIGQEGVAGGVSVVRGQRFVAGFRWLDLPEHCSYLWVFRGARAWAKVCGRGGWADLVQFFRPPMAPGRI